MVVFPINVVASYSPTEPMTPAEGYPLLDAGPAVKPPDAIRAALWAWSEHVSDDPDRRFRITDVAIEEAGMPLPARLTMTVTCEIDAPTEWTREPMRYRCSARSASQNSYRHPSRWSPISRRHFAAASKSGTASEIIGRGGTRASARDTQSSGSLDRCV